MPRLVAPIVAIAFACGLLLPSYAGAQYGGGGGGGGFGGGGFGGGSGMSGGTLQMGSGLNTFSSSGSFGQRSMGGGISPGGNNFGGGQIGIGANGANAFNNLTNVGTGANISQFLNNRGQFVGGAGNTSFVGMSLLSGQNGGLGGGNMLGLGQRQNNAGNQNRNLNNTNYNGNQNNTRAPAIHTKYTVGFDYRPVSDSALSTRLSTQLSKSHGVQAVGPIKVELEGETAVLSGAVTTAHDRALAANMAMLEPGVSRVRNELRVEPKTKASPGPELPAPAGSDSAR
jgi:hypothetical protein